MDSALKRKIDVAILEQYLVLINSHEGVFFGTLPEDANARFEAEGVVIKIDERIKKRLNSSMITNIREAKLVDIRISTR